VDIGWSFVCHYPVASEVSATLAASEKISAAVPFISKGVFGKAGSTGRGAFRFFIAANRACNSTQRAAVWKW